MTLQSSGPISLGDIGTEFNSPSPRSLSQFYRGGGKVPNTVGNAAVPTSGQISLSNFYGASNGAPVALVAGFYHDPTPVDSWGYRQDPPFFPAFGSVNPATPIPGFTIARLESILLNTGSYNFSVVAPTPVNQNVFASLEFVDRTGTFRQFLSSAVGDVTVSGYRFWTWFNVGFQAFDNGGNYTVIFR
jgi:hypothetical protein